MIRLSHNTGFNLVGPNHKDYSLGESVLECLHVWKLACRDYLLGSCRGHRGNRTSLGIDEDISGAQGGRAVRVLHHLSAGRRGFGE